MQGLRKTILTTVGLRTDIPTWYLVNTMHSWHLLQHSVLSRAKLLSNEPESIYSRLRTSWRRGFLEKLMVAQLIKNRILWRFKFNYVFARAYPESAESCHILTSSSCRTNFNPLFPSHLCLSLPSVILLPGFTANILYGFIIFSIRVICRVHLIIQICSP